VCATAYQFFWPASCEIAFHCGWSARFYVPPLWFFARESGSDKNFVAATLTGGKDIPGHSAFVNR
jgi:hypothetical protein